MGCSHSKAPATPGQKCATGGAAAGDAAGDVASSGRAFVSSWVTHASYELPPEDRRAGPPRSALLPHRHSAAFSPSNNNTGASHLPSSRYPGDNIHSYGGGGGGGDGGSRTRRHTSHPNDDYRGDEDDDGEGEGNALVQDEMMEEEEEGTSARVRAWGGGSTTAAQQYRVAVRPTPSSDFDVGPSYYDSAGAGSSTSSVCRPTGRGDSSRNSNSTTPPVAPNDAAARSAKRAPSHAAASNPPPRSSLVSSSSSTAAAVCEHAECAAATNASHHRHHHHQEDHQEQQKDQQQQHHATPLNFPPPPNIFTECGTVHRCLLDENNSNNNSSVKDGCWQGRSVVWQCPAPLNAPPRSRVCSPWFTGPSASTTTCASSSSPPSSVGAVVQRPVLQWRLFWEVQDFGRVRSEPRNLG